MKIAVHKIIVAAFVLFGSQLSTAAEIADTPPPPSPPRPGLPIDGGLVAMFFAALVLGYFISRKYLFNKKSSL